MWSTNFVVGMSTTRHPNNRAIFEVKLGKK